MEGEKEFPAEVMTKNRRGEPEVRLLVDSGKFVRYHYMDPKSGRLVEKGKLSILLKPSTGEEVHYYLIPTSQKDRFLAVVPKGSGKKERKFWDSKTRTAVKPW